MIEHKKVVQGMIVAGHQVASGRWEMTPYRDRTLKLQAFHYGDHVDVGVNTPRNHTD